MIHKRWYFIVLAMALVALAALACGGTTASPTETPVPTKAPPTKEPPTKEPPTKEPTSTKSPAPTKAPAPTKTSRPTATVQAATTDARFFNLEFASQVVDDSSGISVVDPGFLFSDVSEVNAVFEYEGTEDGVDFQRIWYLDGEQVLDSTDPWDSGTDGKNYVTLYVQSGLLDVGQYTLEAYYDGVLVLRGTMEIAEAGAIYQDRFHDDLSGWVVDESENSSKGYEDGRYAVGVKSPAWIVWAGPDAELDLDDVAITAEVLFESGPDGSAFGVVCRYESIKNFYYFVVTPDGRAGIYRQREGKYALLSSSEDQPEINPAVETGVATNILKAVCEGTTLQLYVNDILVAEADDDNFASGDVGVLATTPDEEGGLKVYFDNFVVGLP